ncbi:glycosyltransferase family 4 protein [Isoptericola sp. NPDC057191]|uniref:glycosyltransferase family 4 protein n=1 Tax=Isoptericola sp. NPDC057191 TaxID=3346041 RepID=UPI0036276AC8
MAPEISPGSGVAGVAHALEQAWSRAGVTTARFTLDDAAGRWLPEPGPGLRGRLVLLARVAWFSTVGTVLARRAARREPGTLVVCHNDALAGDVYVNHGLLRVAMRARGRYRWRMVRNPVHLLTAVRDAFRYSSTTHRAVVSLTATDEAALRATYPRLRPASYVVGNGVDLDRFRPPTAPERAEARSRLGLGADDLVAVFVGHEHERKGLHLLIDATAGLPHVRVVVVGGTPDMVAAARRHAEAAGVGDRVHLAGAVADPRPYLHAGDALVLASAYEANALVVLEALAAGLPVVATPVGYAGDVVVDGVNGYLVDRSAAGVRRALDALPAPGESRHAEMRVAARASVADLDWDAVAARYLEVLATLGPA